MTTLQARPAYTPEELKRLYPSDLVLEQVQVVFRHGERTPVNSRFQETGLPVYWPYCKAARAFRAQIRLQDGNWSSLSYERNLETYGRKGHPKGVLGPTGKAEDLCSAGELTDRGRETTLALGQRLRHLYVDQLNFLPEELPDYSGVYLRHTPVPRAGESLHEVFTGLFPKDFVAPNAGKPTIWTRNVVDENLMPNETVCRRYRQLQNAFAVAGMFLRTFDLDVKVLEANKSAAKKWNGSDELKHASSILAKHVKDGVVRVDGSPRLSGILDTVASTLAHGPQTKLPSYFYEPELFEGLEKAVTEEWFGGYEQSLEVRRLGVGSLLGDIKDRMLQKSTGNSGIDGEPTVKVALMGCHDTTVGGILAALGAFDWRWPPYTSSVALELFSSTGKQTPAPPATFSSWLNIFGLGSKNGDIDPKLLKGWYVRLRYNDKPVQVRYCKAAGRHLEGNTEFCTLEAFKEIVEKLTPTDWKTECQPIPGASVDQLPPMQPAE